jgi:hypothetical protein
LFSYDRLTLVKIKNKATIEPNKIVVQEEAANSEEKRDVSRKYFLAQLAM